MPKPHDGMNHGQLKDYIKSHGLNKGKNRILMGHKKPLMVEKLKAAGHWEGAKKAGAKKAEPKKAPKKKGKKKPPPIPKKYKGDRVKKGRVQLPQKHEYTMRGWELGGGEDASSWHDPDDECDAEKNYDRKRSRSTCIRMGRTT